MGIEPDDAPRLFGGTTASYRINLPLVGDAVAKPRTSAWQPKEAAVAEHYDVIIIGPGAGGGTLAHAPAGSGNKILLLERGNFLPREKDNWDPSAVFVDGKYISPDTWYDADGRRAMMNQRRQYLPRGDARRLCHAHHAA